MFKIIAGLGNPGNKYNGTRHNVGAEVLELLKKEFSATECSSKFEAEICEFHQLGKVYLFRSKTFMNDCGKPLGEFSRFYKIEPTEILVIYDDVDLPVGHLRLSEGGSSGHQGVNSVIEHIGPDFWRLRIGIGDNRTVGLKSEDYVLQKFKPDEKSVIEKSASKSAMVIKLLLENKLDEAKNRISEFNSSVKT